MTPKAQQIPVWRACEDCRYRRRNCPHKRAVLLPLKADGPDAAFRAVTDPALIALAVLPDRVRRPPTYSKKLIVSGGKSKARRKFNGGDETEGKRENEKETEEAKDEEEMYGTIAVRHSAATLIEHQSREPLKDIQTEQLGPTKENTERQYITPSTNRSEGLNIASTTDHQVNEETPMAGTGGLADRVVVVEGRVTNRKIVDLTVEEEKGDSIDEEKIQRAITKAIEASNYHHHSLNSAKEIEGTTEDLKGPEELPKGEDGETPRQSNHQDLVTFDETNFYQPSIHTKPFHSEAKLDQKPESDLHHPEPTALRLLKSQSPALSVGSSHPRHPPQSQRPLFPLTPASTSPTPPPPPSSLRRLGSLASIEINSAPPEPATGPARWKLPCVKKSRFSGPRIYTPLTLHPPSGGLGVMDQTRISPRKDRGDTRWERAKRQISEEL